MKGGLSGIRSKQISLTLIGLIGTTILLWAWEKTPLLTTFLPPPSRVLMPDVPVVGLTSSKPDVYMKESYVVPEGETRTEYPEKSSDVVAPLVSVTKYTAEEVKDEENTGGSLIERNGIPVGTISTETEPKHNSEEETKSGQAEISPDVVPPVDSVITISSKQGIDNDSSLALAEEQEISASVPLKKMEPKEDIEEEIRPKPAKNVSGGVASVVSASSTTTEQGKSILSEAFEEKKACNYGKGKWVEDSRRPLYSGFGCKQWLSEMWACRLTQRTDFTYETFRWKPHDCQMPEFEGSSFLKRMQDKTIAFVGDSLGRQQFQSLMCMVTGGKETHNVVDVGREYGLVKAHGATRPDGWAFRFPRTNTTILYYWSASLCDIQPINSSNPATDWAMHLDRPAWFLQHYLHRFDVLVLNTGHHWNRGKLNANRWVMHVNGVPNTDRKLAEIGRAKNFTIYSVVKWLDLQLPKHPRLKAFFRSISPRHFFHGDWNSGGTCDNTTPLAGGKEVLQEESSDSSASGAVRGTGVHLLDITAISQLRDEGHISRYSIKATPGVQDCLHWCLPGIPDTWNEILAARV